MTNKVRVRFAPSPTGALHIGGIRTALYNYLFAKKHGGDFILRIEDTDQTRFVPGAEDYILGSLAWLGLNTDEGIAQGGPCAPYRQSERKDIYMKEALRLVEEDKAYYAFDTPEELDEMRERLKAAKVVNPVYDNVTRMSMKNSITLSQEEVQQRLDRGDPWVIRLKVPKREDVRLQDLVRDWVVVNTANIDDKILIKSDGMPTYHLANVVDDHLMGITHVIRGEEWLPSAPLHVLLYRFLGWENTMPRFAHLPLLLKPTGNGKLSKRDALKHGFPIFPLSWKDPETGEFSEGFQEAGYLPEALINFLALLGWNPGTEQEMFSLEELIEAFSIERIGKSGAKFDIEKAKWFNQQYIKLKPAAELSAFLHTELASQHIECSPEKAAAISELLRERITFPAELYTKGTYFFAAPDEYDEKIVAKKWNEEAVSILSHYALALETLEGVFTSEAAHITLNKVLEENNLGMGRILQALRLALTGSGAGPDLFGIMDVIGREEVIHRLRKAINQLTYEKKA
ncbi:MAG: glutamate--tRNA ligase [Cyclobacteriaceae bacterium]|nr:glutamate--tRNA ligase [Cyclobacteriaceae bacterium]